MSETKTKKTTEVLDDGISATLAPKTVSSAEPTVSVILPLLEDENSDVTVDQTVNVTVNGKVTQIRRGEYVDVKVPVFMQLRNRFPTL